uniref:Putative secreted protein n=1 Tax=Amblyomma americanum TaxID=6943 RepID=A0A0C9SFI2_AMBAM
MAAKHLIWSAVLIVTWLTFCDSTEICHYVKGHRGECNPATKKQSVKLTLLSGNSTCRATKVETEDCTPGDSPFRQPSPAESARNVRTLVQSEDSLVLGMAHEDFHGDGTTQCLTSTYESRSLNDFYERINYSQRQKMRDGSHNFVMRGFPATYRVTESKDSVSLTATITERTQEKRPISGTYRVVYSSRKCLVLKKELASLSEAPCGIWVTKNTFRRPPPDCTTAFHNSCKRSHYVPIYEPYQWLCGRRFGLTQ